MVTSGNWQQPDVALGVITSADNHFQYRTVAAEDELSIVGFTIVNELSGAPKLPSGKEALGKVYAMNLSTAKVFPPGDLTIELIDNAPKEAQIGRYNESGNAWNLLETKIEGGKVMAKAPGAGIFAVFIDKN